jgi:hypothetical protein
MQKMSDTKDTKVADDLFTRKKKETVKLHSEKAAGDKVKSKGVAFYQQDLDAIEELIEHLQPLSKKQIKDSTVVRVAIHSLLEGVKAKDKRLLKDLQRLIYENN